MENVFETLGDMLNPKQNNEQQAIGKKPLWRELTDKRTQGGSWRQNKRDDAENSRIPFAIIIPFNGCCQPIFDSAAFPPNNIGNLARMEGDAEYACLAVNNLHILAEALDKMCKWHEKNATWDKGDNGYYAAKEALSNIS